ncbi:GNAT family N-acetyltransferase [Rossellomorea vietnamensis]|uniref:GNAT family N-acetyltransferase n=1 Tax=Rossellomorea vietnamensis TaxID=218284 RepID=A0A5D4KGV4_9BACI|nr:GNAT family N-acetyltransferase [Rossellomorea vietnamensis]TYR76090.1 GNAT family N-acetyltransferase [Rossellomorea vietnamensis]
MDGYTFVKGYRDNMSLRKSFNALSSQVFGIDFEKWYERGFWTGKYDPYSLVDGDKVIANVSVNKINLIIEGERKSAVQLGTVMTHKDYRGKGFSGVLMKKVLEEFRGVDLIYLFANSTVLEYYPKFGFHAVEEQQPVMELAGKGQRVTLKKLDGQSDEDIKFIFHLAKSKMALADRFSTTDTAELLMFYCTYVFPENIYYWPEKDMIILMNIEGETLHIYDVITYKKVDLQETAARVAPPTVKKVRFHFTVPVSSRITTEDFRGDEVLFVRPASGLVLLDNFKHPVTSQA